MNYSIWDKLEYVCKEFNLTWAMSGSSSIRFQTRNPDPGKRLNLDTEGEFSKSMLDLFAHSTSTKVWFADSRFIESRSLDDLVKFFAKELHE